MIGDLNNFYELDKSKDGEVAGQPPCCMSIVLDVLLLVSLN